MHSNFIGNETEIKVVPPVVQKYRKWTKINTVDYG